MDVSKKVISNTASDKTTKEFNFTVTLSDLTISGAFGGMTFTNGVATFALKDNETKSATGLPVGIGYSVTEASATGFQLTSQTGESGTISATKSEAKFTNTKDEGGLVVSKSVESDITADHTKAFSFKVTLDDETVNGTYGEMTFTDGVAEFTLKDTEQKRATGLAQGIGYTVTETPDTDFTTEKTGDTGTIGATQSTAAFKNTRKTGELEISKSVVSPIPAEATKSFSFTIELKAETQKLSGTYDGVTFDEDGKATVTVNGGSSKVISGIPYGASYSVVEATDNDFELTAKTGETGAISGEKSTAAFTNTRKTGKVSISKTVESPIPAEKTKSFSFTIELSDKTVSGTFSNVTFTNGEATVTVAGGETKTIEGLPAGITYTVREAVDNDFELSASSGTNGTITAEGATAAFTNTRKTEGLTVSKTVVSDAAADADQKFEFTVELSDKTISGTYGAMKFSKGVATVELKGGESATATGLPTGITYEVTETRVDGFKTTMTGDTGTIGGTAEAVFTNTRETGNLEIKKTVTNVTPGNKDNVFEFTITLNDKKINKTYSGVAFTDGVAKVTLKAGESKLIEGLPTDITYKVVESQATNYVQKSKSGDEGTISKKKSTAAFENTYNANGKIVLYANKSITGKDLEENEFLFTLKGKGVDQTKGNKADGSVTFDKITYTEADLKDGKGEFIYKIKEVIPDPKKKGYDYDETEHTVTVTLKDNGDGTITATSDKNADKAGQTEVVFANKYAETHFSKTADLGGEEIADAKITIYKGEVKRDDTNKVVAKDGDGNKVSWTSGTDGKDNKGKLKDHVVYGLADGIYTMEEISAPNGYTLAVNIVFEIKDGYVVKVNGEDVSEGRKVEMVDELTNVKVSKVDAVGGEELEGAHIQIEDTEGNIIQLNGEDVKWVSGEDGKNEDGSLKAHEVVGLKTGETYVLRETVAPDGYTITTTTNFTIDADGTVKAGATQSADGTILIKDSKTKVRVSKTDMGTGAELAGAHIKILGPDGKVVEIDGKKVEWTSTRTAHVVEGLKTGVEYRLVETVAPNGYTIAATTTFTIDADGTVKTKATQSDDGTILIEDSKTKVRISKVDVADGKELEGAKIQILDKNGRVVEEWTSTKDVHVVTGLNVGEEYTLHEEVAPNGYTIAADTKFTIDDYNRVTSSGTVTKDKNGNDVMLIEDGKTEVKVSKVDIANGKELEGAHIQILDKDGNVVDEWTSTKDVHVVTGLKSDEQYTLKETVAPNGYTIAAETTFTIDKNGKVTSTGTVTEGGVMLVEDAMTEVHVSKTDIASGEELEGATIEIRDKDGNVVESWTSGQDGKDENGKIKDHVVKGLKTGETYTLKEKVAPDGYEIATETTFTIDEKGKVTSTGTVTEGGVVLVEDALTSVTISKVDVVDGKEVEGAHIQILDKDGNVVEEWVSEKDGGHEVKGLKTGETYTLKETVAPDGYDITTETTFVLDEKGEIDKKNTTTKVSEEGVLLVEDDRITNVPVEKRMVMPDGSTQILPKAQLRVVKVADDGSETAVESWETGDAAHELAGLKAGTYVLYEDATPNAEYFQMADPITFTVDAERVIRVNGEVVDTVVMLDLLTEAGENFYDTDKNKSKTDVDEDEDQTEDDGEKDKEKKKKKSTTTTTTTNSRTTSSSSTPTRSTGAKTADNTNAALPLAGGSVAMLAILYLLLEEKKRRQVK